LSSLLKKNPKADREFGLLRKGWETDLKLMTFERDSLSTDLWQCQATKPAQKGTFDNFETGIVVGIGLVVLTILVLDAQLE